MLRCIRNSIDAGHVTLEEGQAVQKRIDDVLKSGIGPASARELVAKELEAEAFEKKRRALLTESRRQVLEPQVLGYRNASGQHDPAEAFRFLHHHDGQAAFMDAETLMETILGETHAHMNKVLYEFRKGAITGDKRRLYGQTKVRLDNMVREMFGEDTGDQAAKELAKAAETALEHLRVEFNEAGGAIRKLDRYGLPTHYDPVALDGAGKQRMIEDFMPRLDRQRTVSHLTGRPLTDGELREALGNIWEKAMSDGWYDREPSGAPVGRGALFSQHAEHRFLHFKSADDWLWIQKHYGEGDPFNTLMGHISMMARDIAHMKTFGPNPEAMRTYLKQVVSKSASEVRPTLRLIEEAKANVDAIAAEMKAVPSRWQRLSGELDKVHKEMDALRQRYRPQLGGKPSRRDRARMDQLNADMMRLNKELLEATDQFGPISTDVPPELAARFQDALRQLSDLQSRDIPWTDPNPRDAVTRELYKADGIWELQRGSNSAPVHSKIANGLATARQLTTAAVLGSAFVSAIPDVVFQAASRKFVGLPQKQMLKDLVTIFSTATREEAVAANLILRSGLHHTSKQARYIGSINTREVSGYLVDRVLALQLLSPWTQAWQHKFGLSIQHEYGKRVGLAFGDLPKELRDNFQRHGLSAADWDQIRTSALHEPEPGAVFLRPKEIAAAGGREVARKYTAMILRETRFATPEATVTSRNVLTWGRPGTLAGEMSRNFMQFKSFGVAVLSLHAGRAIREANAGRKARGAAYAGGILIGTTLLAAMVLQLKELLNGRDPRDMDNAKFWGAAMMQGGGWGILGDFLFADVNRFGGGLSATIAGPLPERINRLRNSTIGNMLKLADEDADPNLGRDAVNLLRDWTPGSSLWYARLAYNRVLLDQLQSLVDPDAKKAWRRQQQKRKSQVGNDFWWAPGKTSPDRLPAF